jgi:homoserine dehydrogenase
MSNRTHLMELTSHVAAAYLANHVVPPAELPAGDLLARLDGPQNAVILSTDLLGEFAIVQLDSGLTHTAYALLADLITLGRRLRRQADGLASPPVPARRS